MGVNSLPKTVTRQRRDCDWNPGPSAPESSTLTTRLPSHGNVHKKVGEDWTSFGNMLAGRRTNADKHTDQQTRSSQHPAIHTGGGISNLIN